MYFQSLEHRLHLRCFALLRFTSSLLLLHQRRVAEEMFSSHPHYVKLNVLQAVVLPSSRVESQGEERSGRAVR